MEIKKFVTVIPAGHKFSENEYVRGVIVGMLHILCEAPNNRRTGLISRIVDDKDNFERFDIFVRCTTDQYLHFANAVEKLYPGLCAFDGKIDFLRMELTS